MVQQQQIEPFWLGPQDAEKACLLIHGFMGNPHEMHMLGEALAERGVRVYGMVVAGHDGNADHLIHTGRKDWLRSVEEAFATLAGYKQRYVIGFSMGSALSMLLASRHPEEIAGVVALANLTRVNADGWQRFALPLLPLARHFIGWFYPLQNLNFNDPRVQQTVLAQARQRDPDVKIDFTDRETVEYIKKIVRIPIPALDELGKLTREERQNLGKVRVPLLIIQSKLDQVVKPACSEELYRLTTAVPRKELHWLEHSDHMIVTGPELGEIVRLTATFLGLEQELKKSPDLSGS